MIPVASYLFRGRKGLALLVIDSDRVTAARPAAAGEPTANPSPVASASVLSSIHFLPGGAVWRTCRPISHVSAVVVVIWGILGSRARIPRQTPGI